MRDLGFALLIDGGFRLRFPPVGFDHDGATPEALPGAGPATTVRWERLRHAAVEPGPPAHGARVVLLRVRDDCDDDTGAPPVIAASIWLPAASVAAARCEAATALIRQLAEAPERDAILADPARLAALVAASRAGSDAPA